jgi:hypothetical protein
MTNASMDPVDVADSAESSLPAVAASPKPVTLTVHSGHVEMPVATTLVRLGEIFKPSPTGYVSDRSEATCTITRDVLRHTTTCNVGYGSTHDAPFSGVVRQMHSGSVSVHRDTFDQHVTADCLYRLQWPNVDVTVDCTMHVTINADSYAVDIKGTATQDGRQVFERVWTATHPRRG